jgi:hypothetical protein
MPCYSYRSASIGAIRDARHAGSQAAARRRAFRHVSLQWILGERHAVLLSCQGESGRLRTSGT